MWKAYNPLVDGKEKGGGGNVNEGGGTLRWSVGKGGAGEKTLSVRKTSFLSSAPKGLDVLKNTGEI